MTDFYDDDEMSRPPSCALSTICKDTPKFMIWRSYFRSSNVFIKTSRGKSPAALARLQHLKEVTLPFPPTVADGHRCYSFYNGIKSNWPTSPDVEDTHDFSTNYPYLGTIWEQHRKYTHSTETSFRRFFDNLITTAFGSGEDDEIRFETTYPVPDTPQFRQKNNIGRFDLAWICRIDNKHFQNCQPQENRNLNPFCIGQDGILLLIIIGFLTEYKLGDLYYVRNQVILGLMTCSLHLRRLGIRDVAIYGLAIDSSHQKELWTAAIDHQGRIELDYADASLVLDERTPEGALKLHFFMLNMKQHLSETLLPKLQELKSEDLKNPEFDWVSNGCTSFMNNDAVGFWPDEDRAGSGASGSCSEDGTSRSESGSGRSYPSPFQLGTKRKRKYQDAFSPSRPSFSCGILRIPTPIVNALPTWVNSSAEELDQMLMVPR